MNRRHFALAAAVAAIARTQGAVAQECSLGFFNGVLRYSPECSTLSIPGAPFGTSPPSHLVAPVIGETTTDVLTPEERRIEQLLEERERRDNKKDRRRERQRRINDQQAEKRDKRRIRRNDVPQRSVAWSGVGPQVTYGQEIGAGRYIATSTIVTTARDNFIIWLHAPDGDFDLVVNEIPEFPGSYRYQRVVDVSVDGFTFLEVEAAAGSWTVILDPS